MSITAVFGQHDEKTLAQLNDVASRAAYAALMADGHSGYIMPIGGVAAYRNQVSVPGVGYDIACGNAAIRTDRNISEFSRDNLVEIADEIASTVSFGIGRTNRDDAAQPIIPFLNPMHGRFCQAKPTRTSSSRKRARSSARWAAEIITSTFLPTEPTGPSGLASTSAHAGWATRLLRGFSRSRQVANGECARRRTKHCSISRRQ